MPAEQNEKPSVVYLKEKSEMGSICTGSIYSQDLVLTSGRCCVKEPFEYEIIAGAFNITNWKESNKWSNKTVEAFFTYRNNT